MCQILAKSGKSLYFVQLFNLQKLTQRWRISSSNPSHLPFDDTHIPLWRFPCHLCSPGYKTHFCLSKKLCRSVIIEYRWQKTKLDVGNSTVCKSVTLSTSDDILWLCLVSKWVIVIWAWLLLRHCASQDKGCYWVILIICCDIGHPHSLALLGYCT